ncbi:MAG: hypothetical protein ACRDSH_26070 [Pseudonocardiaceae bacterium]
MASCCPDGQVVATDVGTTFLDRLTAPNLQVMQHNVVSDDFPPGAFDLIHARWLLVNLPERHRHVVCEHRRLGPPPTVVTSRRKQDHWGIRRDWPARIRSGSVRVSRFAS